MLMDYIFVSNKKEDYCECSCDKETLIIIIKDYKETVKKPTIKGLYRYLRQQGYRVDEMISVDEDTAEAKIEF